MTDLTACDDCKETIDEYIYHTQQRSTLLCEPCTRKYQTLLSLADRPSQITLFDMSLKPFSEIRSIKGLYRRADKTYPTSTIPYELSPLQVVRLMATPEQVQSYLEVNEFIA